jgi:hypothetical protein
MATSQKTRHRRQRKVTLARAETARRRARAALDRAASRRAGRGDAAAAAEKRYARAFARWMRSGALIREICLNADPAAQ